MGERQTVAYLTKRFREVGFYPVSRRGQNFLVDLNLLELLAGSSGVTPQDVVLEVGTGTGSLTGLVAPLAAAMVTVEVDERLAQMANEELDELDNVTLLLQDALKNKNNLHANVLDTLREKLAEGPDRQLKLVSNLPYNIATPIISNLLASDLPVASMTITIQKELADRLKAGPSTKDYGALSIWIQSQCQVELVRIMPPTVFWPRPKVHSAIVHMLVEPERQAAIPDRGFFHKFVRSLFFHRRKFLRSVLISAMKGRLNKQDVDDVLKQQQLGGDLRAEQLSVPTVLDLSEAFRQRLDSQ